MELVVSALLTSISIDNLLYIVVGVALGNIIGAIPGLNAVMAIAIAVPLTYYMPAVGAMGFLVGINKGAAFGGSVSAIILNVPGSPDAAATCFDGYPMHCQGKGIKALKLSLFASAFGDFFSTLILILIALPLASLAIQLGPAELCALIIFTLILIADLDSDNIWKGILATAFGLLLSTIGLDPVSSLPRLTFGYYPLENGIPLAPAVIGILALTEISRQMAEYDRHKAQVQPHNLPPGDMQADRLGFVEFFRLLPALIRGSLVGVIVGIVPGIGGTVSAFLSYGVEKKRAKDPDTFGKGRSEGVVAPEAANNAVICASLIPLFTLGIPSSLISALLIGAFILHGITPGPLMFEQHTETVYAIYSTMMLGNLFNLIVGYIGLFFFIRLLSSPRKLLFPMIIFLCFSGICVMDSSFTAIVIAILFMFLGYGMQVLNLSVVSLIIGLVLGPQLELYMQQTVMMGEGTLAPLLTRPLACILILLSLLIMAKKLVSYSAKSLRNGRRSAGE
ncbi:TPA: tripartite tricarboxylate transporter permease [Raoultella ornithinolytica]